MHTRIIVGGEATGPCPATTPLNKRGCAARADITGQVPVKLRQTTQTDLSAAMKDARGPAQRHEFAVAETYVGAVVAEIREVNALTPPFEPRMRTRGSRIIDHEF